MGSRPEKLPVSQRPEVGGSPFLGDSGDDVHGSRL